METLGQIESVANKIRTSSRPAVYALYRLVFEKDGDRTSRKQLRGFRGFDFNETSAEFRGKLEYSAAFSIGDLTSMCNILGLDYNGTKEELRQRIIRALMDLNSLVPHQDDDDTEAEEELERPDDTDVSSVSSADSGNNPTPPRHRRRNNTKITFNFKDVEDTIRPFEGNDHYPIERWITDFEDVANMFEWNDMQKLVFGRKSLKGVAKTFVRGLPPTHSWKRLKDALKEEFSLKVSSADIHRKLAKRKLKKDENLQEYYLAMRELASQGGIDAESVIQYVIDGIPDSSNKVVLYGARDYNGFRACLRTYAKMQERSFTDNKSNPKKEMTVKSTRNNAKSTTDEQKKTSKTDRCYNCGENGHKANTCKFKEKGKKCFKCNNFGHESKNCPGKSDSDNVQAMANILTKSVNVSRMYKEIIIEGKNHYALLDTGSHLSLMREDVFRSINASKLWESEILLTGIAQGQVKTLGHFQTTITIDSFNFPLTFHLVPTKALNVAIILGTDFINQAEITIDQNGVTINKSSVSVFLSQIKLQPDDDETVHTDLIVDKLSKETVENMMLTYKPNKTKTTDIKLSIALKDDTPIFQNPRRLPPKESDFVSKQTNEWISTGIVEPCASDYASPVVVVKKKDGSSRLCIDYRKLNKVIIKDKYPLPIVEDQIDRLAEARVFSTIDLRNGFFHVDVDEKSRKYTAFVTHQGQYQFLKAPFGLCNSPSVFQRFINHIFRPLVNDGILLIYLDDLIIIAPNVEEGIKRLQRILQVASDYGLDINKNKCHVLQSRTEYLGHVIENGKIFPSPDKIKAVLNFPEPRSLKDVQSFLGLSGYFRKYIEFYAIKAKPLSDMLKKENVFQFGFKEKKSFEQLKSDLSNEPVLKIFNQKFETELHTDACKDGFGAILLQKSPDDGKLHPVYYMSRKTTEAESRYTSYELEVLAVIRALEKFRHYLLGIKFKIVTDCAAFKQTMSKTKLSAKIARWALLIEEFDVIVEHRINSRMKHVDALSRYPIMTISNEDSMIIKVINAQRNDPELQAIREVLKNKPYNDYFLRNDVLYKYKDGRELLVIPQDMQNEIIQMAHNKGHFSVKRTEDTIVQEFYIPKVTKKVENVIANCVPCILGNKKAGKKEGFLNPLVKGDSPLYTYHLDHLGPLDSTNKNYHHILAIIDSFTKFTWLYPTKSTTSKEVISKLQLQSQVFGNPSCIITDRGTAFSSIEFQDYCTEQSIKHSMITTGLPRSNGQIERINRIIIPVLTKLSLSDPTKWYKHVPKVQQTLNTTVQRSIGMTPFELLTGVKMKLKDDLVVKDTLEKEFQLHFEQDRDQLRVQAKKQILKVQNENRKTYNLRRREPFKYKIGDLVAIKRVQMSPGKKLCAKFLGPYKIIKIKPNNSYDVKREVLGEGPIKTSTCAEYLKLWSTLQ